MNIFKKNAIGIDIFNESLTLCGYDFSEPVYNEIEQRFSMIKGIQPSDFENKQEKLKELFKYISKSIPFSLSKPSILLSFPKEFVRQREAIDSIIVSSGFDQIDYCDEMMVAAIGCGLPVSNEKEDGLCFKFIFVLCKKSTTTFCICCAGSIFETYTVHSRLSDISKTTFEDIINKLSNKKLELPDSFNDKNSTDKIRDQVKLSLDADIHKTIYILNTDNNTVDYSIDGFNVENFNGYKYFSLGLNKLLGMNFLK